MIYRTVQGDMWDGIAFKIYGDARFLTLLLNANPAHAAVSVFSGNIVLNVPEPALRHIQLITSLAKGVKHVELMQDARRAVLEPAL